MFTSFILSAVNIWAYLRYPRLMLRFRRNMGHFPQVGHPRSFAEKFLWRKLFDHDPRIARLSDKLTVKKYFAERCPDLAVPKTLWIGDRPQDIPDHLLESDAVVKTNHGSNFNVFVENGQPERRIINGRVNHWLRNFTPYGKIDHEWAYTHIEPKVFVEELLKDRSGSEPVQFIVHTYDGVPEFFLVLLDSIKGPRTLAAFETDGTKLAISIPRLERDDARFPDDYVLPGLFKSMITFAGMLGSGYDYVRVDFLLIDQTLYGNEMTFYTNAGYPDVRDPIILDRLTANWDLRKSWFLSNDHMGWRGKYATALRRRIDFNSPPSAE